MILPHSRRGHCPLKVGSGSDSCILIVSMGSRFLDGDGIGWNSLDMLYGRLFGFDVGVC